MGKNSHGFNIQSRLISRNIHNIRSGSLEKLEANFFRWNYDQFICFVKNVFIASFLFSGCSLGDLYNSPPPPPLNLIFEKCRLESEAT